MHEYYDHNELLRVLAGYPGHNQTLGDIALYYRIRE